MREPAALLRAVRAMLPKNVFINYMSQLTAVLNRGLAPGLVELPLTSGGHASVNAVFTMAVRAQTPAITLVTVAGVGDLSVALPQAQVEALLRGQ